MRIELSGHYSVRRLLVSAVPSIVMILVTSLYSIVDGVFVSNFAGTTPFAALNLMWPAMQVVTVLGLMVGTGGSALVSKTKGEGDDKKADAIFSTLVRFTLILGVIMGALFFILTPQIARWLGAEGELLRQSIIYARICISVAPVFMIQMAFNSFFMAAEKPQLGTALSIASGITNIIVDAVLIVWLKMGIAGAAIGTASGMAVGGLYPIFYFSSKRNSSSLHLVKNTAEFRHVLKACSNGLSEYVGNIALSVVSICYNVQLMKYLGENGVSVYGILMYLGFAFASLFIGYNIMATPVIGYNYGAGNRPELKSLLNKSMGIVLTTGILLAGIVTALARPLATIFVSYDPELLDLAVRAIRIYFISFTICGINMFTSAWFTGLNNGIVSAVAAFTRTLVFELGAVFVIPALFGIDAIWAAVNVAEVLALILSAALILAFRRRYGY